MIKIVNPPYNDRTILAIQISDRNIRDLVRVFRMNIDHLKDQVGSYLIYRPQLGFKWEIKSEKNFNENWEMIAAGIGPAIPDRIFLPIIHKSQVKELNVKSEKGNSSNADEQGQNSRGSSNRRSRLLGRLRRLLGGR